MIPEFIELHDAPWKVLPPGIHVTDLAEINERLGFNPHRRRLINGLTIALKELQAAGCKRVYIDGSFVTAKPLPSDFDACWDHEGIEQHKLNPVFLDFSNKRAAQKTAFLGEFFPAYVDSGKGQIYIDFFQVEKHTGDKKGILLINLPDKLISSS